MEKQHLVSGQLPKKDVNSISSKLERYGQVILVSGYLELTGVN